jgi:hypothetical protein
MTGLDHQRTTMETNRTRQSSQLCESNGPLITASQALAFIQRVTGTRVSKSTLWRWHLTGRLKSSRIGGRIFTSEPWVQEMLARDAESGPHHVASRGIAAVERTFDSMGRGA